MRRIYLPIIIAVCLFFMWMGSMMGSHVPAENEYALKRLQQEKQELAQQKRESELRAEALLEQKRESDNRARFWKAEAEAAKTRVAKLEAELPKLNQRIAAIAQDNAAEVAEVSRYTDAQRDSFFTATYPGQDAVVDIDSRKVMADLVVSQGKDRLNTALSQKIVKLEEIGFVKDTVINFQQHQILELDARALVQDQQLTEAQFKADVLTQELGIADDLRVLHKDEAKKYKRQRNGVIAGVTIGIAGTVYMLAR